jgi:hypothetical protein
MNAELTNASEQPKAPPHAGGEASSQILAGNSTAKGNLSFPAVVANTFGKFDIVLRARLLGRLLGSVGPLALAVVGGGVFAKYVQHARSPEIPVSLEDAARATSSQVYDLVHYLEQSNPHLVERLLTAHWQERGTMAAIGATIAAIAVRRHS